MTITSFSCFSDKEVVNCKDGKIIGYPHDLKFDIECGKIISVLVREANALCFFGKQNCIEIMWDKIEKIGDDIILVNIDWYPKQNPHGGKKEKRGFFQN